MTAFCWLEWCEKTPADLGLTWDEVDPWYHDAMLSIKAGYSRAMQDDMGST